MPVKKTASSQRTLAGRSIRSLEEFYDQVSRKLGFPRHFGRNLDALWDVLTADVEGPVKLVWKDSAASRKSMGEDFEKISRLLKEVEEERKDFEVVFE